MAINPLYIVAPNLQEYFVDKNSGEPLAGGLIYTYISGTKTPKLTYTISGSGPNYTYTPLPNPIILSGVGTVMDATFHDCLIYWYPVDAELNQQLYDVFVTDSLGNPQFSRVAWPWPTNNPSNLNEDELINYIPNGQMLAHNIIPNNTLAAGSNVIAQGGMTIELPVSLHSTNMLVWTASQFNDSIPQSPRYIPTLSCSNPSAMDTIKTIRTKFNDVNKFETIEPFPYTFAFWAQSDVPLSVNVAITKYFGTSGSSSTTVVQQSLMISSTPQTFNVSIDFGDNSGKTIDTVNNNDYVAIDIQLPVATAFTSLMWTNLVLLQGNIIINEFPVQTNADMITRGIMGWADLPAADGFELYLPPILTPYGMTWDNGQIGSVGSSLLVVPSPNQTSPVPQDNRMPGDGATYQVYDYTNTSAGQFFYVKSANGIPYARLQAYLLNTGSPFGIPLAGTGTDYATLLASRTLTDDFVRLTVNATGTPIAIAADGLTSTTFTFTNAYVYGGSSTGTAALNIIASNAQANTLIVWNNPKSALNSPGAGTSGFSIFNTATDTSYTNWYSPGFYLVATAASTLVTGGAGKYFVFSSSSVNYYMWFQTGTETDPAVGGRTGIQINIPNTSYTAQDVADMIREALLGLQSTNIDLSTGVTAGSYFTFQTNPASLQNYYVWFTVAGVGTDPKIVGYTPIRVDLPGSPTIAQIKTALYTAINGFKYAAPDLRGMFLRNIDPNLTWDLDAPVRWSYTPGISGNNAGTYELQNFISHAHAMVQSHVEAGTGADASSKTVPFNTTYTNNAGWSETRPVNYYVYPFIRY